MAFIQQFYCNFHGYGTMRFRKPVPDLYVLFNAQSILISQIAARRRFAGKYSTTCLL
jgi:hypothetical protein